MEISRWSLDRVVINKTFVISGVVGRFLVSLGQKKTVMVTVFF